jgi:hypothetical protein
MSLPMLQTARLLLRPLQEDDAEGLHTAYGTLSLHRRVSCEPVVGLFA